MKILWVVNIMLPAYAQAKGLPYSEREGWLSGLYAQMKKNASKDVTLAVCFPSPKGNKKETVDGVLFYGFKEDLSRPEHYDRGLERRFLQIVEEFDPDVAHVFGAEFPHALAFVRAFQNPEKTLIGLQGVCTEIAKHYRADLPESVWSRTTFRDALRRDSLKQQQEKMSVRGVRERGALLLAGHITGRTSFDREFARRLCPRATYHSMNETMRAPFYEGQWSFENARKRSIFIAQGDYPLKGLHFMLRALPQLARMYPDLHLNVAGINVVERPAMKIGAYGEYLSQALTRNDLRERVTFLGVLSAEEMRKAYLDAHLFVCPSMLENSPNALAEAMLLGAPCVSARTGGIPSMVTDGEDGLLFTTADARDLALRVHTLFDDQKMCVRLGAAARARARAAHDPDANYARLMEIYREMA